MSLDPLSPSERREALQAWLDGELPDEAARAVAAWIEAHPEARAQVEGLRRLDDLLGAYDDEPVPEGFADRVLAAAGEVREEGRGVGRVLHLRLRPAMAAAAVLVVGLLAGGVLLLRDRAGREPEPASTLALEAVPADLLEHADLLLTLTDDEFDALLALDPDDLTDGTSGG